MNHRSGLRVIAAAACCAALVGGGLPAAAQPAGRDVPPPPSDAAEAPAAAARLGEVLVKPARGAGTVAAAALLATGGRVTGHRRGGWQVVAIPPGREQVAVRRLLADPSVAAAVPNYLRTAASHVAEEIPWGVRSLRADEVWAAQPPVTGVGVRVAVLDSGVDARHPQLAGRVAPGFDVYGGQGRDDCGHGTAVAGVIGAAHDGAETVGVAPDVTIVPVKVLRYEDFFGACVGDDEAIAQGIRWAADPAGGRVDVINLSLSGPPPSQVLAEAVAYAADQGVLVIAAAGNAGDRVPNYPAAYPEVISVGGLQPTPRGGVRWWPMSTFGAVDIGAPAVDVPVILARGMSSERLGATGCPGGSPTGQCADGTSFAAPHVAGVAALLRQVHPELATATAADRLTRLRQWVLATATDIVPTSDQRGVDLKTGHGRPDAVTAVATSQDEAAVLLAWEVGERVLSPTPRMVATRASLPASLIVTSGTGEALADSVVSFRPAAGGGVSVAEAMTDGRGRASTVFQSGAAGRRTTLTATTHGRSLRLESYVLQRDDNIPGVRLPPSPFRDRLNVVYDVDDVFRVKLRADETIRVTARGVDLEREYIDMYLHSASARDVTNPDRAPLRENSSRLEMDALRLRRTVRREGVYYVHVLGFGSYRARWSIRSPGKVRGAAVTPSTFTPDGDGDDDTARLSWRTVRPGDVTVRIRNRQGTLVRAVNLGPVEKGPHVYRWNGRTNAGALAARGTYRATVRWTNGKGRVSFTSASVRLRR